MNQNRTCGAELASPTPVRKVSAERVDRNDPPQYPRLWGSEATRVEGRSARARGLGVVPRQLHPGSESGRVVEGGTGNPVWPWRRLRGEIFGAFVLSWIAPSAAIRGACCWRRTGARIGDVVSSGRLRVRPADRRPRIRTEEVNVLDEDRAKKFADRRFVVGASHAAHAPAFTTGSRTANDSRSVSVATGSSVLVAAAVPQFFTMK